jgi:hypothetical protein
LFEVVIQDHISHYLKFKLNSCQHGFTKSKSVITNLVTYLEFITPLVTSQAQADAIYFDLKLCLRSEDAFVINCVANLMEVKILYVQQDL